MISLSTIPWIRSCHSRGRRRAPPARCRSGRSCRRRPATAPIPGTPRSAPAGTVPRVTGSRSSRRALLDGPARPCRRPGRRPRPRRPPTRHAAGAEQEPAPATPRAWRRGSAVPGAGRAAPSRRPPRRPAGAGSTATKSGRVIAGEPRRRAAIAQEHQVRRQSLRRRVSTPASALSSERSRPSPRRPGTACRCARRRRISDSATGPGVIAMTASATTWTGVGPGVQHAGRAGC